MLSRSESDGLIDALARLPDRHARVIALAFFGELSHSEITKQLALPKGTVKGRMRLNLPRQAEEPDALEVPQPDRSAARTAR